MNLSGGGNFWHAFPPSLSCRSKSQRNIWTSLITSHFSTLLCLRITYMESRVGESKWNIWTPMITEISSPLLTDQDWWWRTYLPKTQFVNFTFLSLPSNDNDNEDADSKTESALSDIDLRILGNLCPAAVAAEWFSKDLEVSPSFQGSPMIQEIRWRDSKYLTTSRI